MDRLFASADELLAEPLDVVLILSSGDHAPVTIAALERGLHVLVEKPLAYTLRETDDVIAAAERAGKTLMVGMMKQYDPGYQRGVELVQRLRDLRYVEATTLEPENTLYHVHHPIVRSGEPRPPRRSATARRCSTASSRPSWPRAARPPARSDRERRPRCADLLLPAPRQLDPRRQRPARRPRTAGGVLSAHLWAGGTSFTATLAYPNDVRAIYTWTLLPYVKHYAETSPSTPPTAGC